MERVGVPAGGDVMGRSPRAAQHVGGARRAPRGQAPRCAADAGARLASVNRGPGSAAHRFTLRCARDTSPQMRQRRCAGMRPLEQAVAEAADEITIRVELHQRHGPAMEDEYVALGIERDAGGAAEVRARRQAEGFADGGVG